MFRYYVYEVYACGRVLVAGFVEFRDALAFLKVYPYDAVVVGDDEVFAVKHDGKVEVIE